MPGEPVATLWYLRDQDNCKSDRAIKYFYSYQQEVIINARMRRESICLVVFDGEKEAYKEKGIWVIQFNVSAKLSETCTHPPLRF